MNEVVLFPTCLAEEFFPEARDAAAAVLERLRVKVRTMPRAFCCGQAAFNEGFRTEAKKLARRFLKSCEPGTPVVIPSGSCTSMVRIFYSDLLAEEPALAAKAVAMRPWVFEVSQFLVNVMKVKYVGARFDRTAVYHPACHLTRELRVVDEPRVLLGAVQNLRMVDFRNPEECCGFGGLFSVKLPHISAAMVEDKIVRIKESSATTLIANDCGCLMQIGGALHRQGLKVETFHLAEVLAAR